MRIFLVSFFCFLSFNAAACSCAFAPLNNGTVRNANDIFVFQLISAKIEPETSNPLVAREVVGEIRIVDVLRGERRVRSMRYSSSFCCGTRMYVGQYYVAFISSKEVEFSGNTGNLLNLGDLTLNQTYRVSSELRGRLLSVASGQKSLEQEFGEFPNEKMFTLPRPPDPCPNEPGTSGS